MNSSDTRRGPWVVAMLDPLRAGALETLAHGHALTRLRLDDADVIDPGSIAHNQVLLRLLRKTKDAGGRLHLIGLVSDAGVHASSAHLAALIDAARSARVRVVVHALLDGIDAPVHSAKGAIAALEAMLDGGIGRIGTVSGRALGMEGEGRWDRIEKVYKAITADAADRVDSAQRGIQEACQFGNTEAFVQPFVAFDYPGVSLVDSAVHFHFASAGAWALSTALASAEFRGFGRKAGRAPFDGRYACLTPCHPALSVPTLFPRAPDPAGLPLDVLAAAGRRLLVCGEGSVASIAKATEAALRAGQHDLIVADFANPENATRAGSPDALQAALRQLLDAATAVRGAVLVVGARDAANAAALACIDPSDRGLRLRADGQYCDLGPTLLELLQRPVSRDLEGTSLLLAEPVQAAG